MSVFQQYLGAITLISGLISSTAIAGVEIGGTRLIYNGNSTQAAISVSNPDNSPYLIQSWVNKQENGDDNDGAFTAAPPLFKLAPHAQNSVRVMLVDKTLPTDRESVYWLNIKSIPSSSPEAKNELLIAVKSKMKLLYRPPGLKGDPAVAWKKLTFTREGNNISVHNPTPFSVSLYDITINGKNLTKLPTVLPFQSVVLPQTAAGNVITWRAINDYGGITARHQYSI